MSKNTTFTIVTVLAIIMIGVAIFQTTKPKENSNSSTISQSSSSTSKMDSMNMGGDSSSMMSNMSDSVKGDQSFIENMIPHHQEAVDSSNQILISTTDLELKAFVQNVISAQTKEINDMKSWYKNWFGKDYTADSNYKAMMSGMVGKTATELDKEYIKGMIMHHQGAIQMANKIQSITKRPELLKLANDIITSQTSEKTTLMNWMMSKYNNHSMMGSMNIKN